LLKCRGFPEFEQLLLRFLVFVLGLAEERGHILDDFIYT
jgi:hypothetical protein